MKTTDDESVATFRQLLAAYLHGKTTAPGYRSYSGDFENDDDPFVIQLKQRD